MSVIVHITPKCSDNFKAIVSNTDHTEIQVLSAYTEASFISKFSGQFNLTCAFTIRDWPRSSADFNKARAFGIRSSDIACAEIWEKNIEIDICPRLVGVTYINDPCREYSITVREDQYIVLKVGDDPQFDE